MGTDMNEQCILFARTHTSSHQPVACPLHLQVTICGPMLAPLVRMLADHAERCREICVGIIADSIAHMPEPTALIPAIMPALAARHGASPVQVNMAALLSEGVPADVACMGKNSPIARACFCGVPRLQRYG